MRSSVALPDALREFIHSSQWTIAKTMPEWPHEYIVRERVDENLFVQLVRHIRASGYEGKFYRKSITYYDDGGLVYWTMGAPIEETTIINRCKKENTYEHRLLRGTVPESKSRAMKAYTWNMQGGGKDQWSHVMKVIRPDISLLQEFRDPKNYFAASELDKLEAHVVWEKNEGKANKGIAIYASGLAIKENQFHKHQGWAMACEVILPVDTPLVLVNVHGEVKKNYYVTDTLHPLFDDLSPIIKTNKNVIVGGDLNVSIRYGEVYNTPKHKEFLDRLKRDFGLVDCTRMFFPSEQQTIRGRSRYQYQDDYLFVSPEFRHRVIDSDILKDDATKSLSDHNPVWIEIG